MNAQAANLFLIFGPDALRNGSPYPADVLLRAMLNAKPDDLRRFYGQIDFAFPTSEAEHGMTDPQERACITALASQVPEILFFLPLTGDAAQQLIYRLLPVKAVSRIDGEMAATTILFDDALRVVPRLLAALKKVMVRAEFSEESIAFRVDQILEALHIQPGDRKEFLP